MRVSGRADSSTEILKEMTDTAERLCGFVSQSGSKSSLEVKGDIKAELDGLMKRLANLGISGAGGFTDSSYEGIVQEQLADTLKDIRNCRVTIFESLEKKFLPDVPQQTGHGGNSSETPKSIPFADEESQGELKPAADPTPPNGCDSGPKGSDAITVLIGDNGFGMDGYGKFVALQFGTCEAASIERTVDGAFFNAQLVDSDDNQVVMIQRNKISALNGETYTARQSHDRASLTVANKSGNVLFYARFINPTTVRMRGFLGAVDARPFWLETTSQSPVFFSLTAVSSMGG